MTILSVKDVGHNYTFGEANLFDKVSFDINFSDRVGLIGPNGCGKTTLLRIIAGELKPTSGAIVRPKEHLEQGYLRQETKESFQGSLFDYVFSVSPEASEVKKVRDALEEELEKSRDTQPDLGLKYSTAEERFNSLNGPELIRNVTTTLSGLGFAEDQSAIPFDSLSGGEKTKASLARLLLQKPEFLILDEPTNHLDRPSLEWLEQYLRNFHGTYLLVSHDRFFLDRTVDRILDLRRGKLKEYKGGYSFYRKQRDQEIERQWELFEQRRKQVRKLKAESQRRKVWSARKEKQKTGAKKEKGFISHRAAKLAKRAKAVEKRIEQVEKVEKPFEEKKISLKFPQFKESSKAVLTVSDLAKSFGKKRLFSDHSFTVLRGENLCILGPNGSGKTTLMRIILGQEEPNAGEARLGHNVRIGYYDQERATLDPQKTILEETVDSDVSGDQAWVRTILGALMLRGDSVNKKIKNLSEGEKGKVYVAKLLVSGANFLLLDEPTNHLDIDAREAVENALAQYPGTILFVSHDRFFIDRLARQSILLG
ncbi:MAG: ABC-F type ribosomal protection protein [Candidatus Zixiibacteriota bacterium]|nr:MAG: ABC-F type ribosomal protection protein [candidate division Zixibacteria bacterium]